MAPRTFWRRRAIVATLGEALDGITWTGATAMTPRDFGPPTFAPRDCFVALAASPHRVAFVFGSERFGLSNDDLYTCNACLSIPTDHALRLAQTWRRRSSSSPTTGARRSAASRSSARADEGTLADAVAVRGLIAHWQASLTTLGFLDPKAPRKLVSRLHRLANRGLAERGGSADPARHRPGDRRAQTDRLRAHMFDHLREDIACILERRPCGALGLGGAHLLSRRACHRDAPLGRVVGAPTASIGWRAGISHLARFLTGIENPSGGDDRQASLHRSRAWASSSARPRRSATTAPSTRASRWAAPRLAKGVKRHPTLGRGVIVGANSQVLGGFTVGDNARIGSNAVVVKPVPAGATAVGNPARIIQAEADANREARRRRWAFRPTA